MNATIESIGNSDSDSSEGCTFGPVLPPGFREKKCDNSGLLNQPTTNPYANFRAPDISGFINDSEDSQGPVPMSESEIEIREKIGEFLEKQRLKYEKEDRMEEMKQKREQWMTELPEAKACSFGLGPRTFRKTEGPDLSDRSVWTDTPEDKRRKEALGDLGKKEVIKKGKKHALPLDEEDTADKPKSLLEMHQKKMKKEKKKQKKKKEKPERRRFDRNVDLQVNQLNKAQKKSIVDKAQLLNSRFAAGESKYL